MFNEDWDAFTKYLRISKPLPKKLKTPSKTKMTPITKVTKHAFAKKPVKSTKRVTKTKPVKSTKKKTCQKKQRLPLKK